MLSLDTIKTVWISTPPRTASMWLFNVTRHLLAAAGRTVLPETIPQYDEEMFSLAQRHAWQDKDPNRVWVLKVHSLLKPDLPYSRIITSIRDPRDILISFQRFMKTDFNKALSIAQSAIEYNEIYCSYPKKMLISVEYEEVVCTPLAVTERICRHLGIEVEMAKRQAIVNEHLKEKVAARIDQITHNLKQRIQRGETVKRSEIVYFSDENYRAFDTNTGFQTGHVSNYQSGDWRSLLSEAEKHQVNQTIGPWLEKKGYPLE